jgi:hypothetical protein
MNPPPLTRALRALFHAAHGEYAALVAPRGPDGSWATLAASSAFHDAAPRLAVGLADAAWRIRALAGDPAAQARFAPVPPWPTDVTAEDRGLAALLTAALQSAHADCLHRFPPAGDQSP